MIVVAVTGGFASGKSLVTGIFKGLGAQAVDADVEARKALAKGRPAYRAVVKIFGRAFLAKNGQIDRKKLGQHVFSHPKDLKKLNTLIHPGVIFACIQKIERLKRCQGILVLDVPLLFESKMDRLADFTVVVTAGRAMRLRRAAEKGISAVLAEKISAAQWPLSKKSKLADFVIENDGSIADLRNQVGKVFRQILKNERPA